MVNTPSFPTPTITSISFHCLVFDQSSPSHLPCCEEAVSSSKDPFLVDQGTSTYMHVRKNTFIYSKLVERLRKLSMYDNAHTHLYARQVAMKHIQYTAANSNIMLMWAGRQEGKHTHACTHPSTLIWAHISHTNPHTDAHLHGDLPGPGVGHRLYSVLNPERVIFRWDGRGPTVLWPACGQRAHINTSYE